MKPELARFNHVLIPQTKAARDKFRSGRLFRIFRPMLWLYERLTGAGYLFFFLAFAVGVMSIEVKRTDVHVLWGVLVALLLSSLVVSRAFALTHVVVTVRPPARVTQGEEATFVVACLERRRTGAPERVRARPLLAVGRKACCAAGRFHEFAPRRNEPHVRARTLLSSRGTPPRSLSRRSPRSAGSCAWPFASH